MSVNEAPDDGVRVVLKPRRAQPFFGRHPWVFEGAIDGVESESGTVPPPGTVVSVYSAEKQYIASGLWNDHSNIRVRLYSWNPEEPFRDELIDERIQRAVSLRQQLFDLESATTGCRLVFSEADALSGLTVDFYGGYLLVQFTSLALYQFRDVITQALTRAVNPRGIWLRTEKGMRETEGLEAADGLVSGDAPPRPLFIEEYSIRYGVDVQEGQKTGCYLDQRDNRLAAARYLKNRRVLDAFCFSGGFGITAAVSGKARSVLGIDSSESALALASQNAALNSVADTCRYRRGDVRRELESMAEQKETFDAIILDPPRMARTRGGLARAIKGYTRLNVLALDCLERDGLLITCSCSGLVSRSEFNGVISEAARISGRHIQILEQHGQPADHPISAVCPETEYLKMLICRVH